MTRIYRINLGVLGILTIVLVFLILETSSYAERIKLSLCIDALTEESQKPEHTVNPRVNTYYLPDGQIFWSNAIGHDFWPGLYVVTLDKKGNMFYANGGDPFQDKGTYADSILIRWAFARTLKNTPDASGEELLNNIYDSKRFTNINFDAENFQKNVFMLVILYVLLGNALFIGIFILLIKWMSSRFKNKYPIFLIIFVIILSIVEMNHLSFWLYYFLASFAIYIILFMIYGMIIFIKGIKNHRSLSLELFERLINFYMYKNGRIEKKALWIVIFICFNVHFIQSIIPSGGNLFEIHHDGSWSTYNFNPSEETPRYKPQAIKLK